MDVMSSYDSPNANKEAASAHRAVPPSQVRSYTGLEKASTPGRDQLSSTTTTAQNYLYERLKPRKIFSDIFFRGRKEGKVA